MFSSRDILLLVLVAASLPFCFFRPIFGVVLWTVLGFLNPQSFTWGWAHQAPLAQAAAVPTLLGFCFFSSKKRLLCREVLFVVVLWLWFTLTTLNSAQNPIFADKVESAWYHWGLISKILLMTLVAIGAVDSWAHLRWLALAIAGSFGLLVLKSLPGMILSGGAFRIYGPDNSMIADNNDFGLALNMALPFFFFLTKTESNRWLKWLMSFLFLATIPAIFFTYSRGAFVGLAMVLLCMLLQARQRAILVPVALLVFLFAAFLAPQAWRERMSSATPGALDASARSRLNSWAFSWNLAKAYPLMGGGFDAFTPALYAEYAPDPSDVHGPHSIYFGVLAEHGFTGFFLYFALVANCFFVLRRITQNARRYGDEQGAHYANILRFSLIGFLTSGAFLGRAYFDFFFTIVACIAILRRLCQTEWARKADSDDALPEGQVLVSQEAGG